MRSLNAWCAMGCALILLAGCGGQSSTSSVASAGGNGVQSSNQSSSSQTGTGTATVTWNAPTSNTDGSGVTNLAGYNVYYGTDPSSLTQSIQVASGATTSAELTDLAPGTWYFAVTAYTSSGVESSRSTTVTKTIT